jgi:hypothetical protein
MSNFQFGAPPDPAYGRFLSGLKEVVESGKDWRWHGRDQKWYTYARGEWIMEDAGLADTRPEMALTPDYGSFPPSWNVVDFGVPGLFARLKGAYAAIVAMYPRIGNPVWSPWGDGDWRNAIRRGAVGPGEGNVVLPAEALNRIARVRAFEARDDIPHDEAQEIINEIVREYT